MIVVARLEYIYLVEIVEGKVKELNGHKNQVFVIENGTKHNIQRNFPVRKTPLKYNATEIMNRHLTERER